MLDTFTDREKQTLRALKIYPMRTLALEEKLSDEIFEDYDPDSMQIKVNFWRDGLESLTEEVLKPIELKVSKQLNMVDLINLMVSEQKKNTGEDWAAEDVIVLKRNPLLNTSHLETLSSNLTQNLNQLRVYEGVNLFVENKQQKLPQTHSVFQTESGEMTPARLETPKWEIEHELDGFRF